MATQRTQKAEVRRTKNTAVRPWAEAESRRREMAAVNAVNDLEQSYMRLCESLARLDGWGSDECCVYLDRRLKRLADFIRQRSFDIGVNVGEGPEIDDAVRRWVAEMGLDGIGDTHE